MAKEKKITEEMNLSEAIAISRTFPLETLIKNFQGTADGLVTLWRSAEAALSECPDPQTMPRMLELLNQDLKAQENSTWFGPISMRLKKPLGENEKLIAISSLLPLVDWKANKGELEPVAGKALSALSVAQPLPTEVVERCTEKLSHPHYYVASAALQILVNLPPELREKWVPAMLAHLERFEENSEWNWIIECLPHHFTSHREQIVTVLRAGLKRREPISVLEAIPQLGPLASELIPDVLDYIGRQGAFTGEEPHLIHLDPEGKQAVPGLIRLLGNPKETVRYQAVCELEAYGPRAQAAIPALTTLANKGVGQDFPADADAARQALEVIQQPPHGGKTSGIDRILDLVEKAVKEE